MSEEKVVKIDNNYEVEVLREKYEKSEMENELLNSILSVSAAERMVRLENENKELKYENKEIKAASAEKDKRIADKDKQIADINKNIDLLANNKAAQKIIDIKAEYNVKLNNAKSNGSKTVSAKNKQLIEDKETMQNMYDSLLAEFNHVNAEFNQVNEKLDTQTELLNNQKVVLDTQTGLIYEMMDIIRNSSNIDEANREIDELITETKSALGIQYNDSRKPTKKEKIAFTELVDRLSENGMTNKEIARKLYNEGHPFMVTVSTESGREQKVGRYLHKEY